MFYLQIYNSHTRKLMACRRKQIFEVMLHTQKIVLGTKFTFTVS